MSPEAPIRSTKPEAVSNLYTAILALALGVMIAAAAFVAYKCYFDYNTLFTIP